MLKDTMKILKYFKDATDLAARDKYLTIYTTVPIFNFLLDELEDYDQKIQDTTGEQSNTICLALTVAIDKLKKYYSGMDSSVYYISTG